MNSGTLHTLAGCSLALAIGVLTGKHRLSPIPDGQQPVVETAPARTHDDTFSKTIRNGTGPERWLALLSEAEHATAADMAGLVRLADKDEAMVRMLAARWAELDPRHMLNTLYADSLLPAGSADHLPGASTLRDVLLEEWTKSDLAGAVTALTDVPDFSMRGSFRQALANSVMQSDVERGLRLMSEWKISLISDLGKVSAWAARDPRHAAEIALPLSGFYSGPALLKEVGKVWAKSNPAEGIEFAAGLTPDSRVSLGSEIIERWAERDLAAAVAYAGTQPEAMRTALAQGLVAIWGKSDPATALAWSQQNLKGRTRSEVIENLVTAFAEKDLAGAGGLVAGMESGGAQNRATVALFETWLKKGASERETAFDWLAGVPDAEARRAAIDKVGWTWAVGDPAGARDFIASPHGDMASPNMIRLVASIQGRARNGQAPFQATAARVRAAPRWKAGSTPVRKARPPTPVRSPPGRNARAPSKPSRSVSPTRRSRP